MYKLYESEEFVYERVPFRTFQHHLEGTTIYTFLHWHQNIEFTMTTKGRILTTVGSETKVQYPGEFDIINSKVLHTNHWVDLNDVYEGVVLQVGRPFVEQWLGKDVLLRVPENAEVKKEIGMLLVEIAAFDNREETELQAMSVLFRLLDLLKKHCIVDHGYSASQEKAMESITEIIRYVDEHYQEAIDLSSTAELYHYTPEHLSRLFKNHTGFTFHQYLQYSRLLHCVDAMQQDPDIKLLDCAVDNGFPNQKSFIEMFKKTFGCTPSEWVRARKAGR